MYMCGNCEFLGLGPGGQDGLWRSWREDRISNLGSDFQILGFSIFDFANYSVFLRKSGIPGIPKIFPRRIPISKSPEIQNYLFSKFHKICIMKNWRWTSFPGACPKDFIGHDVRRRLSGWLCHLEATQEHQRGKVIKNDIDIEFDVRLFVSLLSRECLWYRLSSMLAIEVPF